MGNFWRAVTTAFIWLMACGFGIAAVNATNSDSWIVVPVLLATLLATAVIWISEALGASAKARVETRHLTGRSDRSAAGKSKREESDKYALLLELMDEDERAEFKEMLKRRALQDMRLSDDGEFFAPTTLKSLMQDDEDDRHNRR